MQKKAKEYMQDNYNIKINECEINSCASPLSKRLSCKNFIFLREEENIEDRLQLIKKDIYLNRKRKINVYDLNGCFINSFDSVKECSLFFYKQNRREILFTKYNFLCQRSKK